MAVFGELLGLPIGWAVIRAHAQSECTQMTRLGNKKTLELSPDERERDDQCGRWISCDYLTEVTIACPAR